jgi:serine/threonine-protein kinase
METGRRLSWLPEGYAEATLIGMGGQAEAWRAKCLRTDRVVCIKRYKSAAGHGFYRELGVMVTVKSPYLVGLLDVIDGINGQMLIMEYCSGGSLRARLESTGSFSAREMIELGRQTIAGLKVLHGAKMVHADLKPENIFLSRRTGSPLYKLADFGIARRYNQFHRVPRLFSQAYAAPEQVAGFAIPASDIYSLGVILSEVIGGDARRGLLPGCLPAGLVDEIRKAVESDPASRPSLESFEVALESARTDLISSAYLEEPDEVSGSDWDETSFQ